MGTNVYRWAFIENIVTVLAMGAIVIWAPGNWKWMSLLCLLNMNIIDTYKEKESMMSYLEDDDFDGPEGIEKVIAVLTASHLDTYSGYPYDWIEHEGKVFVASLDNAKDRNRTQIDEYDVDNLRQWEQRARAFHEKFPDESWNTCVFETQEQ